MTRFRIPSLLGAAALAAVLAACGGDSAETAETTDTAAPAPAPEAVAPAPATDPAAAPAADAAQAGAFLDPNQATREQLLTIPGFDAAKADALIQGRPYNDMVAVDRVLTGLSEEQKDTVYTRLWKPLDLNSATGDEILLIPGVGNRMKHEFEEYRPYRNIEQFRREIGKYVKPPEVARLERYVTIR